MKIEKVISFLGIYNIKYSTRLETRGKNQRIKIIAFLLPPKENQAFHRPKQLRTPPYHTGHTRNQNYAIPVDRWSITTSATLKGSSTLTPAPWCGVLIPMVYELELRQRCTQDKVPSDGDSTRLRCTVAPGFEYSISWPNRCYSVISKITTA